MKEEAVRIQKIVHGGQGLGELADGRKVFVWGALAGELVRVGLTKKKRSYAEGITLEVLEPSPHRIEPKEANYLSTSPWQIMDFAAEQRAKHEIVRETFLHEGIELPDFEMFSDGEQWGYRNKMEYSFFGDDNGLHLALYHRGTHQKQIVEGSALAMPALDNAARAMLRELQKAGVRAGDLKTIIVRTSQDNTVSASLFCKTEQLAIVRMPSELAGLQVYYSDPRSPASVPTKLLSSQGDPGLQDKLLDVVLSYDADCFFQVNVPVFLRVLNDMQQHIRLEYLVDLYCGVGSIGLSLQPVQLRSVESARQMEPFLATNFKERLGARTGSFVIADSAASEALQEIRSDATLVVDPPRAGLHRSVLERIQEVSPAQIAYLSCNPITQARDVALLLGVGYRIGMCRGYNFFPRTPHIESLVVLEK